MPLTDKLKQGWGNPPTQTPAVEAPAEAPKEAAPAAPPPAQDNSWGGYLHWLATASPMANWQRSFEDRFTRGGLDYLFSQLPSPAKTQSGLSTPDFLAQERAKTQAAKTALGPVGQATADIAGYGMSAPLFQAAGINNPILQGAISGGVNAVGHGGGFQDVATQSAEEGAAGAVSMPLNKYVFTPALKAARNMFGSGPPSSMVYPYVKPGGSTQAPTLGGVPGFRDPTYPANMSAQDLGKMAQELEAMPKATGEGADAQNALTQIMQNRINTVAQQGTPTGGTPGSGVNAVREAYWGAGGPPGSGGEEALSPLQKNVARAAGAAAGGGAGHYLGGGMLGTPLGIAGADWGPKALAWALNPASASAYPALAMRPPSGQQALTNLLAGGAPDVDQYLRQQFWPAQGQ
jgi:hypothetical protein